MYSEIIFIKPGGRLERGSAVVRETTTGQSAEFTVRGKDLLTHKAFARAALRNGAVFFEYTGDPKEWLHSIARIADKSADMPSPLAHRFDGFLIEAGYWQVMAEAEPDRARMVLQ